MIRVRISAVELRNCGPWQGAWRVEIPDAPIAVLCRPNEQGKSTLLAAIPAVFWGEALPDKCWFAEDGPYSAAVEFERESRDAAGHVYRAVRDFGSNRVSLEEMRDGQWRELIRGRHTPRGRTADHARWEELVAKYWMAFTRQSFWQIAVLAQPADWHIESSSVQNLISGSGSTTANEAGDRLLERFREISRFSGKAGFSKKGDAKKNGALEEALARRNQLRTEIQEGQASLVKMRDLRERLEATEREMAACDEQIRAIKAQKDLCDELRELRRRLDKAESEVTRLIAAERKSRHAQEQVETFRKELSACPTFLAAGDATLLAAGRETVQILLRQAAERIPDQELESQRLAIEEEYRAVHGWPDDAAEQIAALHERERAAIGAEAVVRERERAVANLYPVPDLRKRYARVAIAAVLGLVIGVTAGAGAGSVGWGLLAGLALGGLAAAVVALLYQPTRENPEKAAAEANLREAEEHFRAMQERLRETQDAVSRWAGREASGQLTQLLQTGTLYREKLRQWKAERDRQDRLRDGLALERLPDLVDRLIQTLAEHQGCPAPIGEVDIGLLDRAAKALQEVIELRAKTREAEQALQSLLESHAAKSIQELADRLTAARRDRDAALLRLDQLKEQSAVVEELAHASNSDLDRVVAQKMQQLAKDQQHAEELRSRRNELERELARQEGGHLVNVARCELELQQTEADIARLERRRDAIQHAAKLLKDAQDKFSMQHRGAVQRSLNLWMGRWTGQDYAEFVLDQEFSLSVKINRTGLLADAKWIEKLSQGAQDQLALAVRAAVLDRLAGDVVLPLLLDDPFLTWDRQRRQNFLQALGESGTQRQIILLTHDPEFLPWGAEIHVRQM